ncbi:hypothetical protein ASG43_05275 [Aureimonas sp. Leaf454]|nr:hypothetical protein ASG43_05275 [Aureimonas sp. Leaf454]
MSRIVAPVAALVGILILVVIAMVVYLAGQQTADAVERQRELARGMIDIRLQELSNMGDDYAHWDEALEKLVLRPDRDWADANIGTTMSERYGVDMSFVVDPAGRTTFAMLDQASSDRSAAEVITTGYEEILARRAAGGPDAVTTGILVADGLPALAVVAPLRPFAAGTDATRDSRTVLIFVDPLDATQLQHLSRIYRLPDLRVATGGASDAANASILVKTIDGTIDIPLEWRGDDPGGRLLQRMLPLLVGLLFAFGLLTVFVLRQTYRAAEALRTAEEVASRDSLSGLWNRAMLTRDLDRHFADRSVMPFALFYLDLDGFKIVNDTHGHDAGDQVIRVASQRIADGLPDEAKAYRIGGDEFAVILSGAVSVPDLRQHADAISARIARPIPFDDLALRVGVTIGIARSPEDAATASKIVRMADQALYAGKRGGKGQTRFAKTLVKSAAA